MTSTMMDVNVDRSDSLPLHDQVAAQIRRAIADGEAGPGERLPLAKDLAAVLGVNKNTVLRALHLLREEGLLEFRRGRGITVVGTPQRGAVPAADLIAILAGLPLAAAVAGGLLAGRQPPAISRQPLE